MQRVKDGELLDVLRVRTAMYTGERTLSAVSFFLGGFGFAKQVYQIPGHTLPPDFHDWVAYRLHFQESTSGYRKMILDRIKDESAALDKFFELLDEHRSRHAHAVAKLHPGDPHVSEMAAELRLVVYTNDPGFFVTHGGETAHAQGSFFRPALSWLRTGFKLDEENLEILDQEQFNRLLQEDEVFREELSAEGKQRKRRIQSK